MVSVVFRIVNWKRKMERFRSVSSVIRHTRGAVRSVSGVIRHTRGTVRSVSSVIRHTRGTVPSVSGVIRHTRGTVLLIYTGAYILSEDFAKPYFHKY